MAGDLVCLFYMPGCFYIRFLIASINTNYILINKIVFSSFKHNQPILLLCSTKQYCFIRTPSQQNIMPQLNNVPSKYPASTKAYTKRSCPNKRSCSKKDHAQMANRRLCVKRKPCQQLKIIHKLLKTTPNRRSGTESVYPNKINYTIPKSLESQAESTSK